MRLRAGGAVTDEQRRALVAALEIIAAPAGKDLGPALDTIERIAREAGAGLDPRLNHYLTGRSYGKALLWLRDRESENTKGNCA